MKKTAPKNFEDALAQLEAITEAMQGNDLPLEDALAAYERGQMLVRYCQEKLAEVEQKLQVLDGDQLKEWQPDDGE